MSENEIYNALEKGYNDNIKSFLYDTPFTNYVCKHCGNTYSNLSIHQHEHEKDWQIDIEVECEYCKNSTHYIFGIHKGIVTTGIITKLNR